MLPMSARAGRVNRQAQAELSVSVLAASSDTGGLCKQHTGNTAHHISTMPYVCKCAIGWELSKECGEKAGKSEFENPNFLPAGCKCELGCTHLGAKWAVGDKIKEKYYCHCATGFQCEKKTKYHTRTQVGPWKLAKNKCQCKQPKPEPALPEPEPAVTRPAEQPLDGAEEPVEIDGDLFWDTDDGYDEDGNDRMEFFAPAADMSGTDLSTSNYVQDADGRTQPVERQHATVEDEPAECAAAASGATCSTPPATCQIKGDWEFMNEVEKLPDTLFQVYGDVMAAGKQHQFFVMTAQKKDQPDQPADTHAKYGVQLEDGWHGMSYYVVKGEKCIKPSKKGCIVDTAHFGDGHSNQDNTPGNGGWVGLFGVTGPWSKTNEYKLAKQADPKQRNIILEACPLGAQAAWKGDARNTVCARVKDTTCYLKRVHVCPDDSVQMYGIDADGKACTL